MHRHSITLAGKTITFDVTREVESGLLQVRVFHGPVFTCDSLDEARAFIRELYLLPEEDAVYPGMGEPS